MHFAVQKKNLLKKNNILLLIKDCYTAYLHDPCLPVTAEELIFKFSIQSTEAELIKSFSGREYTGPFFK